MEIWFIAAGALSGLIAAIHVFAGGPDVARPLLAANELDRTVRYTAYYCWHLVSISLFALAGGFIVAGVFGGSAELAAMMTILAGGFTIWGVALPMAAGLSFKAMPQGWLFLPVTVCGLVGLV